MRLVPCVRPHKLLAAAVKLVRACFASGAGAAFQKPCQRSASVLLVACVIARLPTLIGRSVL